MPQEYAEFSYDYRVDGNFTDWLALKDNTDGWELSAIIRNRSDKVDKHICLCIFRRKLP